MHHFSSVCGWSLGAGSTWGRSFTYRTKGDLYGKVVAVVFRGSLSKGDLHGKVVAVVYRGSLSKGDLHLPAHPSNWVTLRRLALVRTLFVPPRRRTDRFRARRVLQNSRGTLSRTTFFEVGRSFSRHGFRKPSSSDFDQLRRAASESTTRFVRFLTVYDF